MKKVYVLLAVFGIWCLASSLYYMFSIKELATDSALINTQDSGLAIAEILIIILISLLIGFGIAWYLRDDSFNLRRNEIYKLLGERNSLIEDIQTLEKRTQKAEHTLERARTTFRDDYFRVTREKEKLQSELKFDRQTLDQLQTEIRDLKTTFSELQLANQQLEKSLHLERMTKHELEVNLQQALINQEHRKSSFIIDRFAVATEIEKNDIDDLQQIKGIGPVIEKKLNIMGIVSFKQLSELPNEAIDEIAHAIKFFPDRIRRDQWIQQAKELYLSQRKI